MTATPGRTAPTPATPATIPADRLHAVLDAFSAASLAARYVETGNFAAARRKLVQALASIHQLSGGAQ